MEKFMKKIIMIILLSSLSSVTLAVPRNLFLASPKKITVVGKSVKLTFELPCKNEYPDEFTGNLVAVSDDEGDMSMALGVVLSHDRCEAGPMKDFALEYTLEATGLSSKDLENGATFEPIDIAK